MRMQTTGVTAVVALLVGGVCTFGCNTGETPIHPESLDEDQHAQNGMVDNASAANESVAGTQKWQIKTSGGQVPQGWEPFAYDSNDEQDPFLLRRRIK